MGKCREQTRWPLGGHPICLFSVRDEAEGLLQGRNCLNSYKDTRKSEEETNLRGSQASRSVGHPDADSASSPKEPETRSTENHNVLNG